MHVQPLLAVSEMYAIAMAAEMWNCGCAVHCVADVLPCLKGSSSSADTLGHLIRVQNFLETVRMFIYTLPCSARRGAVLPHRATTHHRFQLLP